MLYAVGRSVGRCKRKGLDSAELRGLVVTDFSDRRIDGVQA